MDGSFDGLSGNMLRHFGISQGQLHQFGLAGADVRGDIAAMFSVHLDHNGDGGGDEFTRLKHGPARVHDGAILP